MKRRNKSPSKKSKGGGSTRDAFTCPHGLNPRRDRNRYTECSECAKRAECEYLFPSCPYKFSFGKEFDRRDECSECSLRWDCKRDSETYQVTVIEHGRLDADMSTFVTPDEYAKAYGIDPHLAAFGMVKFRSRGRGECLKDTIEEMARTAECSARAIKYALKELEKDRIIVPEIHPSGDKRRKAWRLSKNWKQRMERIAERREKARKKRRKKRNR